MQYKRSNVLIDKKFQLKFAFFVCTWIFILSMIYPLIIYNLFEYFIRFVPNQSPEMAIRVRDVQGQVVVLLAILQLVFLGITFIISIFLSHRIAGPLYKLRKSLEEISKGNYDLRITFRKNDHFPELQDTFNEMAEHLAIRKWK